MARGRLLNWQGGKKNWNDKKLIEKGKQSRKAAK
jgi:hypothetical protein